MPDSPVDLTALGKSSAEQEDRIARSVMMEIARERNQHESSALDDAASYARPVLIAAGILAAAATISLARPVQQRDSREPVSVAGLLNVPAPFAELIADRAQHVGVADLLITARRSRGP